MLKLTGYVLQLLLLKLVIINGEYQAASSSSRAGASPNAEYAKYYSSHISNKQFKIPTLESLFQIVSYKDKANTSSPCAHTGKKRQAECHKVVTFDRAGYEKSLQDTRKLILSRLNLEREPEVRLSKHKLSFIDQLESRLISEHGPQRTRLDMRTPQTNKILNSMHEASSVDLNSNGLCIDFDLPAKIFFGHTPLSSKQAVKIKKVQSILLWVYVRTRGTASSSGASQSDKEESSYDLLIENLQSSSSLAYKSLIDGWNTIDVKSLIDLKSASVDPSGKLNVTLALRCMSAQCTIGRAHPQPMLANEDNMYEATSATAAQLALDDHDDDDDDDDDDVDGPDANYYGILVSESAGKKPLLSINIFENDDLVDPIASVTGGGRAKSRGKRRTHSHNHQSKSGGWAGSPQLASNYRVSGIDKENYTPKLCYNNYPDSNRECCLVTYFVNFNSLKWSSWILSPSGFVANYCSGKCNEAKSELFFFLISYWFFIKMGLVCWHLKPANKKSYTETV
jgi:hypothetical protein